MSFPGDREKDISNTVQKRATKKCRTNQIPGSFQLSDFARHLVVISPLQAAPDRSLHIHLFIHWLCRRFLYRPIEFLMRRDRFLCLRKLSYTVDIWYGYGQWNRKMPFQFDGRIEGSRAYALSNVRTPTQKELPFFVIPWIHGGII